MKNIDVNSTSVQGSTKFYKILIGAYMRKMFESNTCKPRDKRFQKGWSAVSNAAER